MRFALHAGLTLRRGDRTLQLVRELDNNECLLEDVITRRPLVLSRTELLKRIYAKEYELVLGGDVPQSGTSESQWPAVVDLASLTDRERKLLAWRLGYIKAVERLLIGRGQRRKIEVLIGKAAAKSGDQNPPSASSVMLWLRQYQLSGQNPMSLVDRHRIRKTPLRLVAPLETLIWQALKRHYFTKERHSLRFAYEQLLRALKLEVQSRKIDVSDAKVSMATLARRVSNVDMYQRVSSREGHDAARRACRTAFPDGVAEYPLQRVEIDHTPLNWVVICDRTGLPLGRPTLTLMLDDFSSYPMGFYLSFYGPGLTSVAGVVKNAVMPKDDLIASSSLKHPWLAYGLGDEWVIDNGLEFHSFGFKMMAMALGVDLMYSRVRTPWLKPHVERFFSTLNTLSLVKGRVTKSVANVLRIDPYKDAAITFSDLVHGLLMFLVDVYPHEPNWRKMSTPFELFREGIERSPPPTYPGSWEQLKLAAGMSKVLTLGQGGIELLGLPYGSYAFKDLVNRHGSRLKLLCKWDPDDISQLYVRDPDGLQWHSAQCRWPDYARGLSFNQHRLIRQLARVDLNAPDRRESLLDSRLRLHDHWLDTTTRRGRADALKAGRYAGVTSHHVLSPDSTATQFPPATSHANLISTVEMVIAEKDIPRFEAFSF